VACGGGVGWLGKLDRLARTPGRIQMEVDFRISIEFVFGKILEILQGDLELIGT
jgi:hypothetical protein